MKYILCFLALSSFVFCAPETQSSFTDEDTKNETGKAFLNDPRGCFERSEWSESDLHGVFLAAVDTNEFLALNNSQMGCLHVLYSLLSADDKTVETESKYERAKAKQQDYLFKYSARAEWIFKKILHLAEQSDVYKPQAFDYFIYGNILQMQYANYFTAGNKKKADPWLKKAIACYEKVTNFCSYTRAETEAFSFIVTSYYTIFDQAFKSEDYEKSTRCYEKIIELEEFNFVLFEEKVYACLTEELYINAFISYIMCGEYDKALDVQRRRLTEDGNLDKQKVKSLSKQEIEFLSVLNIFAQPADKKFLADLLRQHSSTKNKKKNGNKNETFRAKFIKDQISHAEVILNRIKCYKLKAYDNEVCLEHLESAQACISDADKLLKDASSLKGKNSVEAVRNAKEFLDHAKSLYDQLESITKTMKAILRAEKRSKTTTIGHLDTNLGKGRTPKRPTLMEQPVKVKTKGVARVSAEEDSNEVSEADTTISSISSFSRNKNGKMANFIFKGFATDLPDNTLECLKLLNDAQDIGELKDVLSKGSDLKKLDGANENVWAFRINDQYRVHFEIDEVNGGFKNVEVGDYH